MSSDKVKQTLEDQIILWYSQNKPVVFQDIMDKWGVNEMYSKSFLNRVKNGHIVIEDNKQGAIKIEE